jgi:hypothetical protein
MGRKEGVTIELGRCISSPNSPCFLRDQVTLAKLHHFLLPKVGHFGTNGHGHTVRETQGRTDIADKLECFAGVFGQTFIWETLEALS